jgi:hypothetical protein
MAQANHWDNSLETTVRHDSVNHAPVLTPVEARQGVVSGRVRLVLAASLTLAVAAFAIIYAAQIY